MNSRPATRNHVRKIILPGLGVLFINCNKLFVYEKKRVYEKLDSFGESTLGQGQTVRCCLGHPAKHRASVLRLIQKANPTLENENWFIIDWVERKWPDLQSPL